MFYHTLYHVGPKLFTNVLCKCSNNNRRIICWCGSIS